eukprot:m.178836 g.178836  ORF g.178836 m.178836 type:complete len:274 (+) comp17401_c3_seq3:464-1285(+)
MLATGTNIGQTVKLWRAADGKPLYALCCSDLGLVESFCFASDGGRLLAAGCDNVSTTFGVWEWTLPSVPVQPGESEGSDAEAAADETLIEVQSRRLRICQAGRQVVEEVGSIYLSSDGRKMCASFRDGVRIFDATNSSGDTLRSFNHVLTVPLGRCNVVYFSPDNRRLFVNRDNVIEVRDAATGALGFELHGLESHAFLLISSPDGKQLASYDSRYNILHPHSVQVDASQPPPVCAKLPRRRLPADGCAGASGKERLWFISATATDGAVAAGL